MAITDINISDTLETSAPSIRYEGNEGPKSPEEQRVAQLKEEYMQYVFEQKELDEPIMSFEEWYQTVYEASKMGVQAPQEQITAEEVMTRAPAAYGGIMDLGGRRRYGWGSKIKDRLRKLIPNEVAQVASVAAPFVAPFNPLIGGLMSGLGGFDKHGSLSRGLKSGLMTYGGGQLARGIGGAGPQWGLKGAGTGSGLGSYFTSPTSGNQLFGAKPEISSPRPSGIDERMLPTKYGLIDAADTDPRTWKIKGAEDITKAIVPKAKSLITKTDTGGTLSAIGEFIEDNSKAILLGSMGIAAATAKQEDVQEAMKVSRGTGLDIDKIRAEVQEAFESGPEAWNELKKKYPYIGDFSTKKAEGGRIGLYAGGQSIPSEYTMEDAMMTTTQDKLGGITDVMKQADLFRQGSVGQFYAAQGGRIGYDMGGDVPDRAEQYYKYIQEMKAMGVEPLSVEEFNKMLDAMREKSAQGGRIGYDAGGRTGHPPITTGQIQVLPQMPGPQTQRPNPMPAPQPNRMAAMNPMMGGRGMHPMMGGRGMNPMMGGRRMAQEGGLMDLGGMEKDYRNDGGFVPIGGEEKADDVPARLSKNEFVFTADAVRGAGGGDIDKGAEIMENIMKNLEQGGQISEESQGLAGAREMFDVSERLSEVV
jgi:hypothetical protein